MASSLYNLALDFSKELNYTKAIMARQGDKGITVTVKPFLNGLQMDTSGGTFTLKGTTPSNRYVDSVATSVTSEEVTFSLDGTFMSEAGYYKHCYVEYRKDDQILTTQDIIFFSLGVSDISQGQADEYVSQLEELIQKYNETFDAFMAEIKDRVDSLNQQITDLTGQAKTLQDKLDALKEEISKLGNLQVMYSNSIDFGGYDYSGNPNLFRNIGYEDLSSEFTRYIKPSNVTFNSSENAYEIDITKLTANQSYYFIDIPRGVTGKRYTYSLSAKADVATGGIAIRPVVYVGTSLSVLTPSAVASLTNEMKRYTLQTNPLTDVQVNSQVQALQIYITKAQVTATKIYIKRDIKLEEGTTSTPYQPNLLDYPYWLGKAPLGDNLMTGTFPVSNSQYAILGRVLKKNLEIGKTYTATLKGTKPTTQTFAAYSGGTAKLGDFKPVEGLTDVWSVTFTVSNLSNSPANFTLYQQPQATIGTCQIDWLKIEKGDTRTPNIEQYKYRGIGMRDSNNPKDYVWDLAPEYVEDNLATDVKISEITGKANNYTDGKVSQINSQLTASINEVDKKVTANTSKIATNTTNIKTISDAMPLYAIYSEGTNISNAPAGSKIPIGSLVATDFAHSASDLPYTISSDGNTLTATRACVLFFEGSVKFHGNNTLKYAYVKIRKNGSDTNFANVGSSANLNYMTSQAGQYVHTLAKGDKVEFTFEGAGAMFNLQMLSLKISEVKPV
ncbi:hypothetical protein MU945_001167 [Enterococcus faecium]|uniref:hypothetical protein n=1 Tax=Enterococcus faecium TaxID=1352 RepID=UPI000DE9EAB0|nr:hypothetical protein [Enterococcus faecium]EME8133616.1 hypothetical protein [Enterococcus faecium]RBS60213.1 hypothetical protein EB33_00713 [Enterococcus faecium]